MIDIDQLKLYNKEKEKYLCQIPPKQGRYFILNTRTSGLNKEDQIMDLGVIEMENGIVKPLEKQAYIHCAYLKEGKLVHKPGINNKYIKGDDYKFFYSDKDNLEHIAEEINNSIIFAHNAVFHMNTLNRELNFWGIKEIPFEKFRCSMKIFLNIIGKIDPSMENQNYISLEKCVEYFGDEMDKDEEMYQRSLYDSSMIASVINNLYKVIFLMENMPNSMRRITRRMIKFI